MRLLLDTHALIWSVEASLTDRLSPRARETIEDRGNELFVSAASAWEIATKHRLGRLREAARIVADWDSIVRRLDADELPVTAAHSLRAGSFELDHADPFDRMLAAQAELDQLHLVTADRAIDAFDIDIIW